MMMIKILYVTHMLKLRKISSYNIIMNSNAAQSSFNLHIVFIDYILFNGHFAVYFVNIQFWHLVNTSEF